MKALPIVLATLLLLTGCASNADIAADKAQDEQDFWEAMGNEGPIPAHDASAVRSSILSITDRSDAILLNGSSEDDCEPFKTAFDVLSLAEFGDERDDYIAPLSNALSQVYSGCDGRDTWEGTIDDVALVSDLGSAYLANY